MCTPEQVREVIHEELFQPSEDGRSRLDKHIDSKLNELFWRIVRWALFPLLGIVMSIVGGWFALYLQVAAIQQFVEEGGRYTQSEHDLYAIEQDRRFSEIYADQDKLQENIDAQLSDIKADVRDIRKAVIGY